MIVVIVVRRRSSFLKPSSVLIENAILGLRLDNLIERYEEPSSMVRWDSPLFTVPWSESDVPIELIWKAITEGNVKPPNMGTQAVRDHQGSFRFSTLLILHRYRKHLLMRSTRWNKSPRQLFVPSWQNRGRLAPSAGVLHLAFPRRLNHE